MISFPFQTDKADKENSNPDKNDKEGDDDKEE